LLWLQANKFSQIKCNLYRNYLVYLQLQFFLEHGIVHQ